MHFGIKYKYRVLLPNKYVGLRTYTKRISVKKKEKKASRGNFICIPTVWLLTLHLWIILCDYDYTTHIFIMQENPYL